ncbi:hypothetical protein [Campylobacter gastrosuis]|uniref:Uncharacterized protein n=1 Tax=Campylobacter gastrosuis TaxID=2974576 RepID=A0ABT7HSX1_9BACT|nr:hypothetical protein [Campylobacter gastrosuis]MDL0090022.1 hypothetical protein [Campylobacter gastrosuis]
MKRLILKLFRLLKPRSGLIKKHNIFKNFGGVKWKIFYITT